MNEINRCLADALAAVRCVKKIKRKKLVMKRTMMRGIVALLLVVGVTGVYGSAFADGPLLEREFEAVDEVEIYFKTVKELTLTGEREVVSFDFLPEENKELGLTVLKDELPVKLFFDKPRRHAIVAQSEHPTVIKILEITDAWIKALKKSPEQECIKKNWLLIKRAGEITPFFMFLRTFLEVARQMLYLGARWLFEPK